MSLFQSQYVPREQVKIKALERIGTVRVVRFTGFESHEVDYFVSWWDEGDYKSAWMPGDELIAIPN